MAKTPSHNVIAAKWILEQLDGDVHSETLEPGSLTKLAESRVSEDKAEKVRQQIDKITGKLIERCEKIVDKFEAPPSDKKGTKPPPPKKKPSKPAEAEDDDGDEDE